MDASENRPPSAAAESLCATSHGELDRAVARAHVGAEWLARLSPGEEAMLLRQCIPSTVAAAEAWVKEACRAKGIALDSPVSAEEWLAGPLVTVRNLRLLAQSFSDIAKHGIPAPGRMPRRREDGRVEVEIFPTGGLDRALFSGFSGTVRFLPNVRIETAYAVRPGALGRTTGPTVALVLGAGNVSSIPAMDALAMIFVEGCACVLKMNPVNEWLGPILEVALEPLVRRQLLRIVYGGAGEGSYLCAHAGIGRVHITGSDRSHDAIVWGPAGPERERRKRENDPVLRKPITSELGNVSPVVIVPAAYSEKQLRFQAANVAAMVANNASFNCNAAKMLVTSRGWPQRERFMSLLAEVLATIPTRPAYYPGAHERYLRLIEGRYGVSCIGQGKDGALPWTLVKDLDPTDRSEPLFRTEPFCAILSETALGSVEAADFIPEAVAFCNDRLWGTLNASLVVHPSVTRDRETKAIFEKGIDDLRYGTVAVNHWPALGYGFVSPPWGGHPSATLADVQSGIGWVHNTYLFDGIEKSVIRGPLTVSPRPPWFQGHRQGATLARKLLALEADPSWWKMPSIVASAIRG